MLNTHPSHSDSNSEAYWKDLLQHLVDHGILTWKEITTVVLGALNPPQVGTSIASNKNFQNIYGKGKTWQAVKQWFYQQPLGCRQCGTLVKLESEHIVPKAQLGPEADRLENLQLLCKRCNAVKRPSHKNAGLTHLTTEAALMWILFSCEPSSYDDFKILCRAYGLTMANIRIEEAWALRVWLDKLGD